LVDRLGGSQHYDLVNAILIVRWVLGGSSAEYLQ
jgi:hypothetical protein